MVWSDLSLAEPEPFKSEVNREVGKAPVDPNFARIAAYVIGTRATRKAILYALLDPTAKLKQYEDAGKNSQRLALMEEFKTMPFGAV